MTGIVASQFPSSRDAALVTRYLSQAFHIGVLKFVKTISTMIKHIYKESENIIEGCNAAFYTNDWWNFE